MLLERIRGTAEWNDRRTDILASSILDEFVATARGIGARPVLIYLPVLAETEDTRTGLTENERFLDGYCAARDTDCLFFRRRHAEAAIRLNLKDLTRYWSPPGHRIVASEIANFLDTLEDRSGS